VAFGQARLSILLDFTGVTGAAEVQHLARNQGSGQETHQGQKKASPPITFHGRFFIMNGKHLVAWALAAILPTAAIAQVARTTKWVNLRASPARDYPLVERLQPIRC
jgi:hypothetical protein